MDHPIFLAFPDVQNAVLKMVRQPDTYNTLFGMLTNRLADAGQTNAYLQFLRDLNVKFKVFGTDHEGDGTVLGRITTSTRQSWAELCRARILSG